MSMAEAAEETEAARAADNVAEAAEAATSSATVSTSKLAWARPEIETVAPGVHRAPLPLPMDGLTAVNVYIIETGDGLLLIDGGWSVPEGRAQLDAHLAKLGYSVHDIAEILVTHIHRDHYSLASVLNQELGTKVWLGDGERENLELLQDEPRSGKLSFQMLSETGADHLIASFHDWLDVQPETARDWATPSAWLHDEMVIERGNTRLRAIATPGHTQGHFVFVDDERSLLYSGDHILPTITPSVGFEAVRNTQALAAFLESLQRVAQLGDLALMPSHGPVGMSSKERTLALLAHHEERLEQILAQVDDGETAYKVASDLQWTRRQLTLDGLEPFSRALAVIETEYHLELLDARGVLTSELVGGVRFYRRA